MFTTSRKNATDEMMIISIDSGSVGIALCTETKEKDISHRTILWKVRERIVLPESMTMEKYLEATTMVLKRILASAVATRLKTPTAVHVVLSSPWQFSQTRFVSQSKEKPFKVSKKLMHDLMKKEEMNFLAEVKQNADHLGNNLQLFESKIMNVTLNGYTVEEPINTITKNINVVMHMASASQEALSAFTTTIHSALPNSRIHFHTSIFAYFAVLRDIFSALKSFLFIEVGEIISETVIIHEGTLSHSVSFPVGLQTQIQEISTLVNKTEKEVATYLRMYKDGTLETNRVLQLQKGLANAQLRWAKVFSEAVSSVSSGIIVPDAIFIVSSEKNIQWIEDALYNEVVQGLNLAPHTSKGISIAPEHFNQYIRTQTGVDYDVPLALFALYISTRGK